MIKDQLEKLYIEYNRELYLYAVSLCRNHHQAQDLVSETFYKAMLSFDSDTIYFKFWLFRVCKNLYIDKVRKNRELENLSEDFLTTKETPLDKIVDNEERVKLYHMVISLSSAYREIIILYYYCDFTIKEISETTGMTEGAAKTLLFRARKKLKIRLEAENEL